MLNGMLGDRNKSRTGFKVWTLLSPKDFVASSHLHHLCYLHKYILLKSNDKSSAEQNLFIIVING